MLPAVTAAALETPDWRLQGDPDRGAGAETADLRHAALCRDCNYCGVLQGSPGHGVRLSTMFTEPSIVPGRYHQNKLDKNGMSDKPERSTQ